MYLQIIYLPGPAVHSNTRWFQRVLTRAHSATTQLHSKTGPCASLIHAAGWSGLKATPVLSWTQKQVLVRHNASAAKCRVCSCGVSNAVKPHSIDVMPDRNKYGLEKREDCNKSATIMSLLKLKTLHACLFFSTRLYLLYFVLPNLYVKWLKCPGTSPRG